jgi:predicted dehydrogenase/threonine dehydrogenase-like Zn-dependent dehydrogenase
MKQVIQSYKTGTVSLEDVPVPRCSSKTILVRTVRSLVSVGTERATIELGKKSLMGKARARPDLVKRVIEKAKKEGVLKTFQEAMGRLDAPTPLGYSAVGVVVEAGAAAGEFSPGDRVACIGQGFASHAEFIRVPVNLACKLPDNVNDEAGAFGMLGIIALHGIRKAQLTFGSCVVVLGLGLLGLITVQLLKAYGCRVFAMDLVAEKADLAKQLGADFASTDVGALEEQIRVETQGNGADAVVLTTATKANEPIDLAVALVRRQGKIVLIGTAGISPDRNALWEKEAELVVSKAGGPGSLEPSYEQGGIDLPLDCARWTPKRNLSEFLRLIAWRKLTVAPLITHRFPIAQAASTYQQLLAGKLSSVIGVLFEYEPAAPLSHELPIAGAKVVSSHHNKVAVSVIGAGLFGKALLIPALSKMPQVLLRTLVSSSGVTAEHQGKKFKFQQCASDMHSLFEDKKTQAVIALTPHSTHAELVRLAILHHKAIFVEKPLCVNEKELQDLLALAAKHKTLPVIMVGHNRRFSPHVETMRRWLKDRREPLVLAMRVNAGFVPSDHWVHSDAQGRSRIVGEMSHFVDLIQFLANERIQSVYGERISGDNQCAINNDNMVVTLKLSGGSVASLTYSAQGSRAFLREQTDVFFDGQVIHSADFRRTQLFGQKNKTFKTRGQQMGYKEELRFFIEAVSGKHSPVETLTEMAQTMKVIFAIEQSLASGQPIQVGGPAQ